MTDIPLACMMREQCHNAGKYTLTMRVLSVLTFT